MGYERPYYTDLDYHPFLFYIIFGVSAEELVVSKERHRVDEFPEGLDLSFLKKPDQGDYMDAMLGDTLGKVLNDKYHSLFEAVQRTDEWAVIRGEIQEDSNLNYMRNAIGFVQALVEKGAVGVLDLQTFSLFEPTQWESQIFTPELDPHSHVAILASDMDDTTVWLHTRGMRKFGRPDISMKNVPSSEKNIAAEVINQMIYYGALGAFFSKPVKLHTRNCKACLVTPEFVNDLDNPDFNNSYYTVLWDACPTGAGFIQKGGDFQHESSTT